MSIALPIDAALPALLDALRAQRRAVLQAPPGAGKTTRVPLAMLEAGLVEGRILMLEPRRLAARAAASRMAETLGEPLGQTVGYRMRGEARVSKATRIEVVTEGILTRMLQSDPELAGIGAVIFDEFHERSLNADLGLALTWEARQALRPELMLLVMSATLDAAPVAALLDDAPLISSEGRAFPVEIRHLDKPLRPGARLEQETAAIVGRALAETTGSLLVFLPGEGEIRRTAALLSDMPDVRPLYGALPFKAQQAAIAPSAERKIVLSTSIAETALTIDGIRVVVDAGRARRARYDPGRGMSRLVTEAVTQAEATQRAGRAGRVEPGICYRLWTRGQEGALQRFPPPEIAAADLAPLALELAVWGAQPEDLTFLTPPPAGSWTEAQDLLRALGALDSTGVTAHGRAMAALPLHPRLAHMLAIAGPGAAPLAALLSERDPMRDSGVDLTARLRLIEGSGGSGPALSQIRIETRRLAQLSSRAGNTFSPAQQAALAYPDRVGQRRKGDAARYLLSGGTGAEMPSEDILANARLIVACELDGGGREACIRLALQISEGELRAIYPGQIAWQDQCLWSKAERRVIPRRREMFGALILAEQRWEDAPPEALAQAMLDGVQDLGLPWSAATRRLQARIALLPSLPDCSDAALMADLAWLKPSLYGLRSAADLKTLDLVPPLLAHIGWDGQQRLNQDVPPHVATPLGRKVPIDYGSGAPEIAVKLQEMFGTTHHPTVAGTPLKVTLLSPAGRPLQTTTDLPGFWRGAYAEVRKEMRGRYPKHPWPEDPTQADPTLRAKPRN